MSVSSIDDSASIFTFIDGGLSVVSTLALVATLLATVWMAKSAARQADAALLSARLEGLTQVRPLLSVVEIQAKWEAEARRLDVAYVKIVNAGIGAASNVVVSVGGYAQSWNVFGYSPEGFSGGGEFTFYGAMSSGDSRYFKIVPVGIGLSAEGRQTVSFTISCFDVVNRHFEFVHQFLVSEAAGQFREVGLSVHGSRESISD